MVVIYPNVWFHGIIFLSVKIIIHFLMPGQIFFNVTIIFLYHSEEHIKQHIRIL